MDLFDRPAPVSEGRSLFARLLKPTLVGVALVGALFLTFTRRGPAGEMGITGTRSSTAQPRDDKRPYDLSKLHIFNNTLMHVNDAYVDPTRVDPKAMLLAALDQVQKQVAEVLVEPHAEQNRVVVRVDTAQQEFNIPEVDSPWTLSMKMREIFRFIQQNLAPGTDSEAVRNIEYAATNGMLSTLDPHSMLLEPQMYNEMKLNTRGSFGGLGIVIGIRKGSLTVIRPMPGTPASQAGLKAGDRIVRIEKESTVNMMLNDAVSRLRGEPDTKVELWVEKAADKAATPKRVVLQRAVIQVRTITSRMLKNNVGYVRIEQSFAGTTGEDLRRSLEDLQKKGMKAIVLDLRSNPGGLLEQAIKVTDEFVDTGTIVTTVGYANKQREEKRATPGTQPHLPMAVLVNHGSASASEIVAGALKNLDRGVLIGTRTFGKGSVQVLYDNDDGSALKLTIAQYLTPGDVSIQSVGITPDVMLEKVAADKEKGIWLYREYKGTSEAELDAHLTSKNAATPDKPFETIKYLSETPPKKIAKNPLRDDDKDKGKEEEEEEDPEEDLPPEDKFVEDYEIQFARDLVAQAKGWKRRDVLSSSKLFFDKKTAEEQARVTEALKKLGVDWSAEATSSSPPKLVGTITTDKKNNEVQAGETINVTVSLTNKGPGTAAQVRAQLKGHDPLFDGREFMFGKMKAGETRSWSVPVKVFKDSLSRVDLLNVLVFEQNGAKAELESDRIAIQIAGVPRPVFAYSYQFIDDIKGNGDGLVQKGESVRLRVTVKNTGVGKSNETLAQLRNLSDEGLFINKGRFNVDNLKPGEEKSVDFTFDLRPEYKSDTFRVELSVYDAVLHEYVTDKLTFAVAAPKQMESASGAVQVSGEGTQILGGAADDSSIVGTTTKGATFKLTGTTPGYYRVEVEAGRPGFIAQKAASKSSAAPTAKPGTFVQNWQVSPPRIQLAQSPTFVPTPTLKLQGMALDDHKVADVFVFVTNRSAKIDHRKVFYQSNRKGSDPKKLSFDSTIPLWPGANTIAIVARESNQVQSQQTLIIERTDGKNPIPSATGPIGQPEMRKAEIDRLKGKQPATSPEPKPAEVVPAKTPKPKPLKP